MCAHHRGVWLTIVRRLRLAGMPAGSNAATATDPGCAYDLRSSAHAFTDNQRPMRQCAQAGCGWGAPILTEAQIYMPSICNAAAGDMDFIWRQDLVVCSAACIPHAAR